MWVAATPGAQADQVARPAQDTRPAWSTFARGGYARQFDSDLDGSGSVAVDRLFVQGGVRHALGAGGSIGLALGYGYDSYDFSGTTGFAALRPWRTINTLRLSAPIRYRIREDWMLFAIPTVRFAAEGDASLGDGAHGGALVGVSHRFSPRA